MGKGQSGQHHIHLWLIVMLHHEYIQGMDKENLHLLLTRQKYPLQLEHSYLTTETSRSVHTAEGIGRIFCVLVSLLCFCEFILIPVKRCSLLV